MTMLNQAAVEALCSATYLENYLETMENLPDDLQRCVTQLRELDLLCMGMLYLILFIRKLYICQLCLKLHVVGCLYDFNKVCTLDAEFGV